MDGAACLCLRVGVSMRMCGRIALVEKKDMIVGLGFLRFGSLLFFHRLCIPLPTPFSLGKSAPSAAIPTRFTFRTFLICVHSVGLVFASRFSPHSVAVFDSKRVVGNCETPRRKQARNREHQGKRWRRSAMTCSRVHASACLCTSSSFFVCAPVTPRTPFPFDCVQQRWWTASDSGHVLHLSCFTLARLSRPCVRTPETHWRIFLEPPSPPLLPPSPTPL